MIYTNKLGKDYRLYYSDVILRGGKPARVFFLLPVEKKPSGASKYETDYLPPQFEIREIGVNHTPLVYKVKNGWTQMNLEALLLGLILIFIALGINERKKDKWTL